MLNFEPVVFCLFLILILGISHGALDNIKGKKLLKLFGYKQTISFYLAYVLISSLIIIFWLILSGNMEIAFWVTLVAAISDALDGIIAKSFNLVTVLGGYLDPIADKTLLVFTYLALWQQGYLPDWLVILVVFREISKSLIKFIGFFMN